MEGCGAGCAEGECCAAMGRGLRPANRILKRSFDLSGAVVGLALTWWIILAAWVAASVDTRQNGLFRQRRVGRHGRLFTAFKLRTMRSSRGGSNGSGGTGSSSSGEAPTTITAATDARITCLGRILRRTKLDELPQLINIIIGDMSFVGPRPDVPGYADRLQGDDRVILTVRPGITGPATLKYRDEEELLATVEDPVRYNDEVIYPDKVRINREYVENYSWARDLQYIWRTVLRRG